jgi:hypothetical protein
MFSLELSLPNAHQQQPIAISLNLGVKFVLGVSVEVQVEESESIVSPASHAVVDLLCGPVRPGVAKSLEFMQPAAHKLFLG